MKLLKRVNTVITAQLHEVVECFENPERMLKQTIREMEATLEKALESTARAIAGEKQLERRLADIRSKADSWQAQAQAAVKRGEETAARNALARRFELERMASALAPQLVRCQQ
jgi:phage shock protein A